MLLISSVQLKGQIKPPFWEVGFVTYGAVGKQAPFWTVSNRQGKYLPDKFAGSMEVALYNQSDTGRFFNYDYGLELYGRAGPESGAWIHQAFAAATFYGLVRLRAGLWEETIGSRQPALSAGSVIWSGNARPLPKLEIGTPGYLKVPLSGGYAEFSGRMLHGWFENGRYASDVMLHHKNFYVRIGGDLPVNIYYGLNHYAQWGGSSPRQEEPYPSDFKSFMRVFLVRGGDPDQAGTPEGWVINRFGNHLGSRNYGIDLSFKGVQAGVYLQDVFEDNSGFSRKNFPDGLWGIWLRFAEENRPLQAVVYEILHTTYQSGPFHDIDGDTLGGNDNYFNHGHYKSGWTYHNYTIGTPLITSPVFYESGSRGTNNNRVVAHHLGMEGSITTNYQYRAFLTFSRNLGTYNNPFTPEREQFSWMLEFNGSMNYFDLEAGVTLAGDIGKMYGDNFGIIFSLRKRGSFAQ